MANAKRCDRCGMFYMQHEVEKYPEIYYPMPKRYHLDLCKDCSEELQAWVDEFRKGEDNGKSKK